MKHFPEGHDEAVFQRIFRENDWGYEERYLKNSFYGGNGYQGDYTHSTGLEAGSGSGKARGRYPRSLIQYWQ